MSRSTNGSNGINDWRFHRWIYNLSCWCVCYALIWYWSKCRSSWSSILIANAWSFEISWKTRDGCWMVSQSSGIRAMVVWNWYLNSTILWNVTSKMRCCRYWSYPISERKSCYWCFLIDQSNACSTRRRTMINYSKHWYALKTHGLNFDERFEQTLLFSFNKLP